MEVGPRRYRLPSRIPRYPVRDHGVPKSLGVGIHVDKLVLAARVAVETVDPLDADGDRCHREYSLTGIAFLAHRTGSEAAVDSIVLS